MTNNIANDPNCVALWKFDNDANDSVGGNDLTEVNTPAYDSVNKKEGTHSIDLELGSVECCVRADGDLDANFPGKSGTSEQSFSICEWVKPETVGGSAHYIIISKYFYSAGNRTFSVSLRNTVIRFLIGYNAGANSTAIDFNTGMVAGRWYHVAVTYNHTNNAMIIRIWDDNAGDFLDANKVGAAGGDMSPTAADLEVGRWDGGGNEFDGLIDELAFFKDVLTDDEIDRIRAGTYLQALSESASVAIGIVASASRAVAFARSSSVIVGVLVSAARTVQRPRSASVIIGNVVTATKSVAFSRASSVIIGVVASASRAVAFARSSSVIIGVVATASRALASTRASSVIVGVVVSATKTPNYIRTASVIIGNKVTASRVFAATRSSSVVVGVKVTASRTWAALRTASVQIGTVVSASRVAAFTRSSSVIVGVKVTATIRKVRYFIGHLITSAYRLGNAITTKYRRGESITASPTKGDFIEGD